MRRVLIGAVVVLLAVGAAFAVRAIAVPNRGDVGDGSYSWGGRDAISRVSLDADWHVTPEQVVPGGTVRYRFTVVNDGHKPVRHLAVRSEKQAGSGGEQAQPLMWVDDRDCWAGLQVSCLLPRLDPGQRRDVNVTVRTSPKRVPGERLVISTFVGRFTRGPADALTFDVSGPAKATVGRFVAPGPHNGFALNRGSQDD